MPPSGRLCLVFFTTTALFFFPVKVEVTLACRDLSEVRAS